MGSRTFYPPDARSILWSWATQHVESPYPDAAETDAIAMATGLSDRQVKTWFSNFRRTHWKSVRKTMQTKIPSSFDVKEAAAAEAEAEASVAAESSESMDTGDPAHDHKSTGKWPPGIIAASEQSAPIKDYVSQALLRLTQPGAAGIAAQRRYRPSKTKTNTNTTDQPPLLRRESGPDAATYCDALLLSSFAHDAATAGIACTCSAICADGPSQPPASHEHSSCPKCTSVLYAANSAKHINPRIDSIVDKMVDDLTSGQKANQLDRQVESMMDTLIGGFAAPDPQYQKQKMNEGIVPCDPTIPLDESGTKAPQKGKKRKATKSKDAPSIKRKVTKDKDGPSAKPKAPKTVHVPSVKPKATKSKDVSSIKPKAQKSKDAPSVKPKAQKSDDEPSVKPKDPKANDASPTVQDIFKEAHKRELEEQNLKSQLNTGRWRDSEHRLFLAGIDQYGTKWKKVVEVIKTRTLMQVRTHAQKHFQKLARAELEGRNPVPLLTVHDGGDNSGDNGSEDNADCEDGYFEVPCPLLE